MSLCPDSRISCEKNKAPLSGSTVICKNTPLPVRKIVKIIYFYI